MVQLPLVHDVVPTLASALQLVPQPPQLVGVVMFTSQPLLTVLSQLRNPAAHVSSHIPILQPALVVFALPVQSVEQLPQVAGSVMLVSQLVPFMSQSRWVLAHVSTRQLPVAHVAVAFAMAHVVPQLPQLLRERVLVSQPSAMSPLQFAKPAAQVIWHMPLVHVPPVVLGRPVQLLSQVPQVAAWVMSVSQSVSSASQSAVPLGHAPTRHRPAEQTGVVESQTVPQAPQLLGSSARLSQRPSSLQSSLPGLHPARRQVPVSQVPTPLLNVHVELHAPQSVVVSSGVSQPSTSSPLQSAKPASQPPLSAASSIRQVPVDPDTSHRWVATLGKSQTMPHMPQLSGSSSSASHPVSARPSQSL